MSHRIFEEDVDLIIAHIKANIGTALAGVRTDTTDAKVTTEVPASYFFYNPITAYRCPAIVLEVIEGDTRLLEQAANHINAMIKINVYCIVQDKSSELLARKSWRYMRALSSLLYGAVLTSADNKVKIVTKLERYAFGDEVTTSQDNRVPAGVFQKGCMIELSVEHYENL